MYTLKGSKNQETYLYGRLKINIFLQHRGLWKRLRAHVRHPSIAQKLIIQCIWLIISAFSEPSIFVNMRVRWVHMAWVNRHLSTYNQWFKKNMSRLWRKLDSLFFRQTLPSFHQDNNKPHSVHVPTACLCSQRVWVLNWPTFSPICHSRKIFVHYSKYNKYR